MSTKWDDTSWQKEFLEMKAHKPSDVRLLMKCAKGFKDVWHLGTLDVEYERLKKDKRMRSSNERRNRLEKRIIRKWKI